MQASDQTFSPSSGSGPPRPRERCPWARSRPRRRARPRRSRRGRRDAASIRFIISGLRFGAGQLGLVLVGAPGHAPAVVRCARALEQRHEIGLRRLRDGLEGELGHRLSGRCPWPCGAPRKPRTPGHREGSSPPGSSGWSARRKGLVALFGRHADRDRELAVGAQRSTSAARILSAALSGSTLSANLALALVYSWPQ